MMNWYKISQESVDRWKEEMEDGNAKLEILIKELQNKYSGLELFVSEHINKIHIHELRVPLEIRHQGIGGEVLRVIKEFAVTRGKPVTLSPQAERGYKKKLDNFYKDNGFVDNKGRNMDYSISYPFGRTMYWKPKTK